MYEELNAGPHRRFNPLTREWVLVSPHRTQRPWQGKQEKPGAANRPEHDPNCYLCPGNTRSGGQKNADYADTFVFENDFSALLRETQEPEFDSSPFFRAEVETGICKVVCFSPRHNESVPDMSLESITKVVQVWITEVREFRRDPGIEYVQIFENKGEIMGCSIPHPHCQIWASSSLPGIVEKEQLNQREYLEEHGRPMLLDYVERELEIATRVIYENNEFAVVVPFWAVWPFELLVLPKQHCRSIDHFSEDQLRDFADVYRTVTRAYNCVFDCDFPYTAGIHQAPSTANDHDEWQLHMHFYPPLLRSATVKKFMVGYEMLATPQRDITAEFAAASLRDALARSHSNGNFDERN